MKQTRDFSENPGRRNRYALAISAMLAMSITAGAAMATPAYADEGAAGQANATQTLEQPATPAAEESENAAASAPASETPASDAGSNSEPAATGSESGSTDAANANGASLGNSANNIATAQANALNKVLNTNSKATYKTLSDAILEANDGDTLQVDGEIEEQSDSYVKKKKLTIVGTKGSVVNLGNCSINVYNGGDLTLGDGDTTTKGLTFVIGNNAIPIQVAGNGTLTLKDGATLESPASNKNGFALLFGYADTMDLGNAVFHGEGGAIKNGLLYFDSHSTGSTITGGTYDNSNGDFAIGVNSEAQIKEISGGIFTARLVALFNCGTIGSISGGTFTATDKIASESRTWVNVERPSGLTNLGTIDCISGGTFVGGGSDQKSALDTTGYEGDLESEGKADSLACGLSNGLVDEKHWFADYPSVIKQITGGSFTGTGYGIYNAFGCAETVDESTGATECSVLVTPIKAISGITAKGALYDGLLNCGSIETIANSTFVGGTTGVYNAKDGVIDTLVSGTYYGYGNPPKYEYGTGYLNASNTPTKIEPDITGKNGIGRYWGGQNFDTTGEEFEDVPVGDGTSVHNLMTYAIKGKVVLPAGYHLTTASEALLPSSRAEEDGFNGNTFRYLTNPLVPDSDDADDSDKDKPASDDEQADTDKSSKTNKVAKQTKADATTSAAAEDVIPKTGDSALPFGIAGLAVASLLVCLAARFKRRKA